MAAKLECIQKTQNNDHIEIIKNFKAVLMGIVLPDKRFSYIFVGFPGSNHDAYVFSRSSLCRQLESENCGGLLDSETQHILGDSAFAVEPWMIVPYKERGWPLSATKTLFNKKLSSTRVVVEHAYGDLKNRFRRLMDVDASVEKCVLYVAAFCIIHNMCIENGDFVIGRRKVVLSRNDHVVVADPFDGSGVAKRESFRRHLIERRQ